MNDRFVPETYDDNPEWTEADFARAKPASEILPPAVAAALTRKAVPVAGSGQQVAVSLDHDLVERFQRDGGDWQARINDALRRVAGL